MTNRKEDFRGERVVAYKCKACRGEGKIVDYNRMPSPYEPIGFSERRLREVIEQTRAATHTCQACKGRGVIYEKAGSR